MRNFQSRFAIGDAVLYKTERGVVVGVKFTASQVIYQVEFDEYILEVESLDINPA